MWMDNFKKQVLMKIIFMKSMELFINSNVPLATNYMMRNVFNFWRSIFLEYPPIEVNLDTFEAKDPLPKCDDC